MTQKLMLAAAVLASLPGVANAFPRLSQTQIADALSKRANATRPRATTCPNLSGSWTGSCVISGQPPQNSNTVITQTGCDVVFTDGQGMEIAGSEGATAAFVANTQTGEAIPVAATSWTTADWSSDGTALVFEEILNARALGQGGSFSDIFAGSASVKNGQLVVTLADTAGLLHGVTCTYNQQQ